MNSSDQTLGKSPDATTVIVVSKPVVRILQAIGLVLAMALVTFLTATAMISTWPMLLAPGPQGSPGLAGEKGKIGSRGPSGVAGDRGDNGSTGFGGD